MQVVWSIPGGKPAERAQAVVDFVATAYLRKTQKPGYLQRQRSGGIPEQVQVAEEVG
jgi:hypothetical protein